MSPIENNKEGQATFSNIVYQTTGYGPRRSNNQLTLLPRRAIFSIFASTRHHFPQETSLG